MTPAIFLDRDGTLIHDPGYLRDPGDVRLLPGAADAVRRLNQAGFLAIVVTNQSGIARGLLTEQEYRRIEARIEELLAQAGGRLDAQYFCPHLPEISGPCDCRKPGTLLYHRAAERFPIDFTASWWIGDRLRDVEPARTLGGRGILITSDGTASPGAGEFLSARDLPGAVDQILTTR
jgi:D-glycero-D-manno-heptose 1,7-bisphosphate phosphatase